MKIDSVLFDKPTGVLCYSIKDAIMFQFYEIVLVISNQMLKFHKLTEANSYLWSKIDLYFPIKAQFLFCKYNQNES